LRILISGSTGVIGRRVVPLLLSQGHSVTALMHSPASAPSAELAHLQVAVADLFNADALKRAAAGHDALINMATHMPPSPFKMLFRSAWRLNDRIRTEGVANLVGAALDSGIDTFIQESFALTYPDRGDTWIDENTALAPADYNRTVIDAESSIAQFSASGRNGIILRFAAFYGPDAMQLRAYINGIRRQWALLPGRPEGYVSSVSHDDAAAAVAAALTARRGAYNVVDDEPVTRTAYFGSLAEAIGMRPPRFLPVWATPLFGTAGPTMARSLRLSNRKLKEETGWTPRFPSIREGWPITLAQMGSRRQ
jgi:nucleoside-diphosphate-sugar epimerase